MREIDAAEIMQTVKDLFLKASFALGEDVVAALERAGQSEESEVGKEIISRLL